MAELALAHQHPIPPGRRARRRASAIRARSALLQAENSGTSAQALELRVARPAELGDLSPSPRVFQRTRGTSPVQRSGVRAMVLERRGEAAAARRAAGSAAGARAGARPGRAPAASAAPTCTSSTASFPSPKLPLVPGHQIVGEVAERGDGAERLRGRRPDRHPVARLDLRRVPLLPLGPREPVRARPLHRLSARRRLRRARGRRRALLPAAAGRLLGRSRRAPLLCAG